MCSSVEARVSRQYGSQTPIPSYLPDLRPDPREHEVCPRPPASSRPHSLPAEPIRQSHAEDEVAQPSSSPVRLPSVPSPTPHNRPLQEPAHPSQTIPKEGSLSASHTASLLVRSVSRGERVPIPLAASVPSDRRSPTRESSPPPFPDSNQFDPAVRTYRSLLRAREIPEEALRGTSLEDLRVLARLVTSIPKEKTLAQIPRCSVTVCAQNRPVMHD